MPVERSRWIATRAPSRAGRIVPEKRTRLPLWTRVALTDVPTLTATPTVTIGLTISGLVGIRTRYCVFSATETSGNANSPCGR